MTTGTVICNWDAAAAGWQLPWSAGMMEQLQWASWQCH